MLSELSALLFGTVSSPLELVTGVLAFVLCCELVRVVFQFAKKV